MGFISYVFFGWLAVSVVTSGVSLYKAYHSPRCPPDASKNACLRPLFAEGELVDFYLYVTDDPQLRWWTARGIRELQRAPVWNATAAVFGVKIENVSAVPLALEHLHGVRRNESALRAHAFLVRGGY